MRFFICLLAAALLSACTKMDMASGYTQGNYQVVQYDIQPANQEMARDPGYLQIKKILTEKLPQTLQVKKGGPDVGVTIVVYGAHLRIDPLTAVLIGDNYRMDTHVILWDAHTKQQIGKTDVSSSVVGAMGLSGVFGDPDPFFSIDEKTNIMVNQYLNFLRMKIYPSI